MVKHNVVITRVPLRISFAGGGTDLPDYYSQFGGAVLSATINRYVYVTVKSHGSLFPDRYRLNYFDSEHANSIDEIENNIMRECLRLVPIDESLYVSTVADIPTCSGLGSSSAFAVGLLHALHTKRGDHVTLGQLAEEACDVEINILRNPIGKQDQYAAAFGGLNQFNFDRGGQVSIRPQILDAKSVETLFSHVLLFWTGMTRDSSDILTEQKQRTKNGANIGHLDSIKVHCEELCALLSGEVNMRDFGEILHRTWLEKRKVAQAITSSKIDEWYELGRNAGAYGGKICGAGGGGFLMLIVPPECQANVRRALVDLPVEDIMLEPLGSCLILKQ